MLLSVIQHGCLKAAKSCPPEKSLSIRYTQESAMKPIIIELACVDGSFYWSNRASSNKAVKLLAKPQGSCSGEMGIYLVNINTDQSQESWKIIKTTMSVKNPISPNQTIIIIIILQ